MWQIVREELIKEIVDPGRLSLEQKGELAVNLPKRFWRKTRKGGQIDNISLEEFVVGWKKRAISPLAHRESNRRAADLRGKTQEIWTLLTHPKISKSEKDELDENTVTSYLLKIKRAVVTREPVPLVFIAFPFKPRFQYLKTNRRYPDLGELLFLVRLLRIDATISQIYEPGLEWTILTEGHAYGPLFGVTSSEVEEYQKAVRWFAGLLTKGREEKLKFLELQSLLDSFSEFSLKYELTLERFRNYYEEGGMRGLGNLGLSVLNTMWWSTDIRAYPPESVLPIYYGEEWNLAPSQDEIKSLLWEEATEKTLRYLAHNEARHQVGVPERLFPDHLYVSITHKKRRYAFYPVSRGVLRFPHHGVPAKQGRGWKGVEIVNLVEVLLHPRMKATYIEGDFEDKPFFYTFSKSKPGKPTERIQVYGIYLS